MALPTLTQDWRFNVNQNLDSPGTGLGCFQQLILAIKNTLITGGSGWTDGTNTPSVLFNPWTLVASSDSVTASASDLWDSNTDLVWAITGTAHSWVVLRQAGIHGANFEICIDLNSSVSNFYQITLVVSWTGFDVGAPSILTRPTASDEKVLQSQALWANTSSSVFDCILHVLIDSGGENTRIIVCRAGAPVSTWVFAKPIKTIGGWNRPAIAFMTASAATTYALFYASRGVQIRYDNVNLGVYLSADTHGPTPGVGGASGVRLTVANEVSSEWPLWSPKIVNDYSPAGVLGELSDVWWGSTGPADGDTYPATGTLKQFVQFSDWVHPWNQTTPLLT